MLQHDQTPVVTFNLSQLRENLLLNHYYEVEVEQSIAGSEATSGLRRPLKRRFRVPPFLSMVAVSSGNASSGLRSPLKQPMLDLLHYT
jgi:hypothetical protein